MIIFYHGITRNITENVKKVWNGFDFKKGIKGHGLTLMNTDLFLATDPH
jgi:hypothetical protein